MARRVIGGTVNIYYAHCMAIYNTEQEVRDIQLLEDLGFTVINPNERHHKNGWAKLSMGYFDTLLPKFKAVAFRANPDGSIPSGVAYEVDVARNNGKLIIELPSGILRRSMTLAQTREYLTEIGQR